MSQRVSKGPPAPRSCRLGATWLTAASPMPRRGVRTSRPSWYHEGKTIPTAPVGNHTRGASVAASSGKNVEEWPITDHSDSPLTQSKAQQARGMHTQLVPRVLKDPCQGLVCRLGAWRFEIVSMRQRVCRALPRLWYTSPTVVPLPRLWYQARNGTSDIKGDER